MRVRVVAVAASRAQQQPPGDHENRHQPHRPGRDQAPLPVDALPRLLAPAPERLLVHAAEVWRNARSGD
jgi:hypothetical protein